MINILEAKELKKLIKTELESSNFESSKELLDEYEKKFSFDFELYSLKAFYYFNTGDLKKALKIANEGLKFNEYDYELLLNRAIININLGNLKEGVLDALRITSFCEDSTLISIANDLLVQNNKLTKEDFDFIKKEMKVLTSSLLEFPFTEKENCTGKVIFKDYFSGVFNNYSTYRNGLFEEDKAKDIIEEAFAFYTTDLFKINPNIKALNEKIKFDCIIPLVSSKTAKYKFILNEESISKSLLKNRVYFLKLKKGDLIQFDGSLDLFFGDKIVTSKKPKLLLNIFIDGLSQKFLEENGKESLMPLTYKFFKEGTIFNNCYVSGEWTLVSVASMFTGKYTHNHRLYHPLKNSFSLNDERLYFENLSDNNFFTAKIDGDWRSNPNYSYYKGLNRYLYSFGRYHMQANEVVMHSIEHLRTFKDTNQALWVCLPDLHDVADEYEHYTSIQTQMDSSLHKTVSSEETSVQKKYSKEKCELYKYAINRLDTYVSLLLNYVKDNYDTEDYIINLVSDHGQGYLADENLEFLNDYRVKVPFMTRGFNIPKGESDELIQALDLFSICSNAFNIKTNCKNTDSIIPKTLGGKDERKYVFSESLYPNRTYKASFRDTKRCVFFETVENVTDSGIVDLTTLNAKVTDKDNNELDFNQNLEIIEYYKNELIEKLKFSMKI